ncbi:hypothetical protein HPB50_012182 [Hyalomma asiaticum]|uniref:Uncharacterized protein n=1 Tax=Hyalomma asiaticum TaxID=266040 RepID=A0ACB7SE26_HYAAI|nr:hypothetical protein HPB50_012182 [Hyalomma asiaticum]
MPYRMIRTSLFLLLAVGTVSQAYRLVPFRYLKTGGTTRKVTKAPHTLAPKYDPGFQEPFLLPSVPYASLIPTFYRPWPAVPPTRSGLTTYVQTPPGGVIAALVTPRPLRPAVLPAVLQEVPQVAAPVLPRPENFTLLSKLSSGPSITTTVFRAPGGVSATSVQRVNGLSTSFFRESDSHARVTRKPVSMLMTGVVPHVITPVGPPPPRVPPYASYLVYRK